MSLYKRVSQVRTDDETTRLREEIADRYGTPPAEVEGLLRYARLRLRAERLAVAQVDRGAEALHIRFSGQPALPPEALVRVVRALPGATVSAQGVLRLPIPAGDPLGVLAGFFDVLENNVAALAASSHL
jgi:transcription-repair coupling factor (superfamily II helicase)